jgi:hypothetical protein
MRFRPPAFVAPLRLCAFVFLLATGISGAPQGQGQRVVAIGDIHGDLDSFVGILQRARLIDPVRRWSGAKSILVQTGDFLDRGPTSRGVIDLLMSLQRDAQRQGGRVVVLMGNHEAMNIVGDLRYVSNKDYAEFADDRPDTRKRKVDTSKPAGFAERCEAFAPVGKYGRWLRSLPAVARVNDSVFLHGGISPDLASSSIEKINEGIASEIKAFDTLRDFLVDKDIAKPCDTLDKLTESARAALDKAKGRDAELLKTFLGYPGWLTFHDNGPLWYRGYAQWTDADGAPLIQRLVEAFGVARFVVGHTPQPGGQIGTRFNGKIYLVDTGMLAGYVPGGRASALNMQDGKISFIY